MRQIGLFVNLLFKKGMSWASLGIVVLALLFMPTRAPHTALAAPVAVEPELAGPNGVEQFGPSSYMPLLSNNYCSGIRDTSSTIGTQLYGRMDYGQSDFDLLQNTQTVWVRNSIVWAAIEPTNRDVDDFIWGIADQVLAGSVTHCANLIVTIENTAPWATISGDRAPIKVANLDDYAEFVAAVVERYDGDGIDDAPNGAVVNYWEFYNEPDFGSEVPGQDGWGEFGTRYAEMLKTVYPAVKAANPNAKVVMGGIAYNLFVGEGNGGLFVRSFFDDVLAADGGEYFDVMNFHYYPFQHNRTVWTQTNSSGLREKYADIKAKMTAEGIGDKPIMITEVGWHSATTNADYPSNPLYQARRVLELLTQAKALGSMATIWWTFDDQGPEFPYSTGLITRAPHTTKPAYPVYLEAVKRLGNATYDSTVVAPTVNNDLEAYRFINNDTNKAFYVAWLNPTVPPNKNAVPTFDESTTQPLQVDGNSATVINRDGSVQGSVSDGDDGATDGKLTVTVGRSPIYIVLN